MTVRSVLVTGGAGFVGSHLCRALVQAGARVVAIDNLQNGLRENVPAEAKFIQADLGDPSFVELVRDETFDAVMHCAAQSSNTLSFRDPVLDLHANLLATLHILRFCADRHIPRLVFTSSMSVYGQPDRLPTPEIEPTRPLSPYAINKVASEQYLRQLAPGHGVQATIFRLYTTYGPGQNLANRDQGLVSIYLSYLLRGEPIIVKGPSDRLRDIVYVDDVVRALLTSLGAPVTYGRTYNLASGRTHRVSDIVGWLIRAAGESMEYPVRYVEGTPGDPQATHGDVSLLRANLGWEPRVQAADGLAMTVAAYRRAEAGRPR